MLTRGGDAPHLKREETSATAAPSAGTQGAPPVNAIRKQLPSPVERAGHKGPPPAASATKPELPLAAGAPHTCDRIASSRAGGHVASQEDRA